MKQRAAVSVITLALVAVAGLALVRHSATASGQEVPGSIDPAVFDATMHLKGEQLREVLGIAELTWAQGPEGITLSAPAGYEHLENCGENLAALRVVHSGGTADCIPGASLDAESGFRAGSAILRISQDRIPSDTEVQILRVENELAFADQESPEHDALLSELFMLEDQLTATERAVREQAYARLAVD